MKHGLLILLLLASAVSTTLPGEKSELKWKKLDAGLVEAKRANKVILMDVYTDWCKWCKKLDSDVYGNDKVAKVLNKEFVLVKINAESSSPVTYKGRTSSEMELAQALGVNGYPTIFFLDQDGEPINSLGGYVDADRFLPIVKYFGEGHYKTTTWEEYKKQNSLPD